MIALLVALGLCALGTICSVTVPASLGRRIGFALLSCAGVSAIYAGVNALRSAPQVIDFGAIGSHLALRLDAVSAFFVFVLGGAALIVGLYGIGPRSSQEQRTGRTASASACAILFASLLACCANDVWLFIFSWELLALTFYWAIAFSGNDANAQKSAYLTITITHVAGACIIGALLFLAHQAHSFDVRAAIDAGRTLSAPSAGVVLILFLVGFGAKFGVLPMQAWLPYGYRSAPPLVAALMAGGALNVGFYGVTRFIVGFPDIPLWFGILAVVLGAVTSFFGIAWASAQRDIGRLAAYSSVENGGIILSAFGVAMASSALHDRMLFAFAIAAAFVQILAHAAAKSTLFLAVSSIAETCGSTLFEDLGGLARRMPIVTIAVLVCGMSLAALPPFAGFVGEWLVLEVLMQAFRTGNISCEIAFALSGATIGVAAGIAVVAFTKLVGIAQLGAPRSPVPAQKPSRSAWRSIALLGGACAIAGVGIATVPALRLIGPAIDEIAGVAGTQAIIGTPSLVQPTFAGFSSISPSSLAVALVGFTLLFWIIARCFARPRARDTSAWASGEQYHPWTQYTGTGYANPTRVILDAAMRTVRRERVSPQGTEYESDIRPFFDVPFYNAIATPFLRVAYVVRATQSGVIAAYLSYILAFTIALLIIFPSIRHW